MRSQTRSACNNNASVSSELQHPPQTFELFKFGLVKFPRPFPPEKELCSNAPPNFF